MTRAAVALTFTLIACASAPPTQTKLVSQTADGKHHVVTSASPTASTSTSSAQAEAPFQAKWRHYDGPSGSDTMYCANWSGPRWAVELHNGAVAIVPFVRNEDGDPMPFPFHPTRREINVEPGLGGERHLYPLPQGYLIGFDAGEWGGALYFFSKEGAQRTLLSDGNFRGFVDMRSGLVGLKGLAHMTMDEGELVKIAKTPPYVVTPWKNIGAAPVAFFRESPDSLTIVTYGSVLRIRDNGEMQTIDRYDLMMLVPNSIVVDSAGVIYVGLQQFVVRWIPTGPDTYRREWSVRDDCVTMERDQDKPVGCHCIPRPFQP